MAISHLYPTERPEKTLNFASSSELDPAVTFARATAGTFLSATGSLVVAPPNTPRFNYRFNSTTGNYESLGLLIEGASTNYIRNNTTAGAVAGTPGTLPTNWGTFFPISGVTRTVVGTGTENGIDYLDLRLAGTPSAAGSYFLQFDNNTSAVASIGQTWTTSVFLKLASGSLAGINAVLVSTSNRNSLGDVIAAGSTSVTVTSNLRRFSNTFTNPGANTAYEIGLIELQLSGAAIDITLRIGLPQLEQAEFPSSVIRTSSGAASRSADIVNISGRNFSSWYDTTGSMVLLNAIQPPSSTPATGYPRWAQFDQGDGSSNFIGLVRNGLNSSQQQFSVFNSSQQQAVLTPSTAVASDSGFKFAADFSLNDFRAAVNGTLAVPDPSGTLPSPTTLGIGQQGNGTLPVNSSVSSILYYPGTSYSDTVLQSLTGGPSPSLWNKSVVLPSYHIAPERTGSVVDLVTGSNLITFSNAAPAMGFNSAGILVQPSANVPFIEYDPATGACLGWRIWDGVTNSLVRSEEFDNASWSKSNVTITANNAVAPTGATTADKLVETTANGSHLAWQSRAAQNETVTFSVFCKAAERTHVQLELSNFATAAIAAVFNLSTGAVVSVGAANADYTSPSAGIINCGGGIYRCFLTATKGTANNTNNPTITLHNGTTTSYAGNGTSGIHIFGAQVNPGPLAPYVPTGASTASSTADAASITGAAFAGIVNTLQGTLYASASVPNPGSYSGFLVSLGTDFNNSVHAFRQSDAQGVARIRTASVDQYLQGAGATWTDSSARAMAIAYSAASSNAAFQGALIGSDTAVTLPAMTTLSLGSNFGFNQFRGYIRELAIFKSRLPNNILQYITT